MNMIKTINNINVKSFSNYSMPQTLSFEQKNLFFGYNGRGKSSLAKGIEIEALKDEKITEDNIRFYNSDYMQIKLINSESKRLKGIKALFGKKDANVDASIEKLKGEIKDTSLIKNRIESFATQIDTSIKSIEDTIRGHVKIRHSIFDTSQSIDEYLQLFQNNYSKALKIVSDIQLDNYTSDFDYENKKNQIYLLPDLKIALFEKEVLQNIQNICSKEYNKEKVPAQVLLDWIRNGIVLHKKENSKKCMFCGSQLNDLSSIEKEFDNYLKNSKVIDSISVQSFTISLEENITCIESVLSSKQMFVSTYINDNLDVYFESLVKYIDEGKKICDLLKQKTISFEKSFNGDCFNEFIELMPLIQEHKNFFFKIKERYLQSLENEQEKMNDILKGSIAKQVINSKNIQNLIKNYKKELDTLSKYETDNNKILDTIKELKNSISPTSNFASFINNILEGLEIKFRLEIIDNDYRIVPVNGHDEISIKNISEGEKNLLSLLFFFYDLFEDEKQQRLKPEVKYIILDDPISSLDDNNHTYIINIITDILSLDKPQLFVLTHDWDDFCKISYRYRVNNNVAFFEIKKNQQANSFIEKTITTITPYEHDFLEILQIYETKSENDISESEIYHLANSTRRVLEHFLKFKTTNSNPTYANIDGIKNVLIPNEEDRSVSKERQLSTLLNVINVMSHESSRNAHEVFISIKFLMNRIKEVDKSHYNMMKNKLSTLQNNS